MGKSIDEKGLIKKIDDMGRISLPIELRKMLNIKDESKLEIGVDGDKIVLTKYSPMTTLKEWGDCIISAISSVVEHDILLTDAEKVINANKKKYLNRFLTGEVQELIYQKEAIIKKTDDGSNMVNIFADFEQEYCCELIVPIIKNENNLGAIIVLATENKCFDDDAVKVCRAFSSFLTCVIL